MTIEIVDEKEPLRMTRSEHDRLLDEYRRVMMFYAGPPVSFEAWVRALRNTAASNEYRLP